MMHLWRRHVPPCESKSREFIECKCPIHVDWRVGSQRIRKTVKTRNWQKALKIARQWEIEGFKEEGKSLPIVDATKRYIADAEARGLREPTIYKFKLLFKQLEEFAKDNGFVFVSDFDVDRVRQFRVTWINKNFAAQKKLESLRSFFRFAHDAGWIESNPAAKIKGPQTEEPEIIPFTADEVKRILAACEVHPNKKNRIRLRALVLLMRFTGLRIRDAVTLSRDRIQDGKLYLRTTKTRTKVYCPLPKAVLDALAAIPGEGNYYFWTGNSKPKSAVGDYQRALQKIFVEAKVPKGFAHNFRHTFATTLLEQGVPLETVAMILGHKSPAVTKKHYDHWVQGRQERLEETVKNSWAQMGTF